MIRVFALLAAGGEHGDKGATNRHAGAVQRVDEARALSTGGAVAGVHPPRLELAADGAG